MGRRKLDEQEVAEFRAKLMDQALILFAKHGYRDVSIRAIALATGCSAMTPYRYFENKEAIFDACRARAFERFAEFHEQIVDAHPHPVERINALGQGYADYAAAHTDAFRLMFELDQPSEPSNHLTLMGNRAFDTLRNSVRDAVQQGYLKGEPEKLAHLFWATIHGIVVLDLTNKLTYGIDKHALLESFFEGEFTSARNTPEDSK